MNFIGKFDAKLASDGFTADSHVHVEQPSAHAPADAIIVPDAHLLFGADFKRSGVDLILSNADRELVVHDYFKGEHRHPLASPDGAHLTGDIVNALTGQVQYAQAGTPDPVAHVIGHVTKLSGSATAVRNGVSVILNNGDNVEKGDVVATGSDSTLGVTFIDGTVFGLSSNARMVLNEMVYDPNGSNNSSLISLVAGTISFVAGETAKHGDMKVDTPVATMGIRGTAVLVEIDFNVPGQNGLPDAKFQVLVEPDGHTGSYILFDKTTLDPIATVNKAGQQVNINQNGISYTNSPLTPELQKLITDVFTQKFSNNDTNTKTFDHFTDSIVPQPFLGFKGPDNIIVQTVFLQTNSLGSGPSQNQGPNSSKGHLDVAPTVGASSDGTPELAGVTGSPNTDKATGFITFGDLNLGDQPTASAVFHSFSYQDAQHHDISLNLTPAELAAVQAVEVALDITQDPSGLANGTAHWAYNVSDAALDFLGQNETLTLTYYVTVSNNFAQSIKTTTVPILVTITGSNDVPKIDSVVPQTIAFLGGTNVAGGDLTAHVPTSGTILFDDPDLTDTHTVSVAAPTSTLTDPTTHVTTLYTLPPTPLAIFNQALTASITDATTHLPTDSTGTGHGSISWSLADLPVWLGDFIPQGEILTLTYAVTVTDSQNTTATQDITVAITGTATPAVVWIATTGTGPAPDGLWSTGANWETGNAPTFADDVIIITDQLEGLTPTYPVTITSAVGPDGAAANSLAMDNFGGSAPELINQDTLQVFGSFTIQDHSTDNPEGYVGPELNNQGTLTIDGALNLDNDAVLLNSGGIGLWGGGTFGGASSITNTSTGTIAVSGGTLDVNVDIANSGQVAINVGGALTLAGAAINGGQIINDGTLTLNGNATVENGMLYNVNVMNVSGTGNALINETIYANPIYLVPQLHSNPAKPVVPNPILDSGDGGDTIVFVDSGLPQATIPAYTINITGALTLNGTTIDSGLITSTGTIDVTGNSAINAEMTGGQMTVETGVILTTDVTAIEHATITNKGTIEVDQNERLTLADVALTGGEIINSGAIEIVDTAAFFGPNGAIIIDESGTIPAPAPATTTITGTTITNNLLTIDGGDTLALSGATINGGTINDFSAGTTSGSIVAGDIDVTGSSTINGAHLNKGDVTIGVNATLTLDGSTVTGTSFDDSADGATIQVDGGVANALTLSGVHINGGAIDAFTSVSSGSVVAGDIDITGSSTISNAHLNNGNVTLGGNVTLTLDGTTVTGTSFDDTAGGATIQVDGGVANTLTLSGAHIDGGVINAFTSVSSGSVVAGDIDVTGSSTISNAHLNNGDVTIGANATLTLDGSTVTGTSFDDSAGGATIQVDGGAANTLTLSGVHIDGGIINAFTSVSSGSVVAGDIDITGSSTISNAHLNNGNVTLGGNVTLTLTNDTVAGASFADTAGGATIQIVGNTILDDVTISGGTLSNSGTIITIDAGQTLQLQDGVTVSGGTLSNSGTLDIESSTGVTLNDVTITGGGAIQIDGPAPVITTPLVLEGGTSITGGTLTVGATSGSLAVETAVGATLDHVGVTNDRSIEISAGSNLTLDDGTTVANGSGTLTVDGGATLTLNEAEITGGTINNSDSGGSGTIDVTGSSKIDGNATLNGGNVQVGNATLTLDHVTVNGTSFDDTASGATIQIDGGIANAVTLSGATINGGTINAFTSVSSGSVVAADIDVTGSSTISNAALNQGNVTLGDNVTLTLNGSTVTGTSFDDTASGATIQVDGGDTLTLSGASINGGVINDFTSGPSGSIVAGDIDVTGSSTISNATLNHGNVTLGKNVTLTLDGSTVTGASFDDTASGATIQVDGGDTLTLSGAMISGGTIDAFTSVSSGSVVAADIDISGSSTISNAVLNNGDVTLGKNVTLTLDGTTVNGASFDDTAGGATIDVTGTMTLNDVSINGGSIHGFATTSPGGQTVGDLIDISGSSSISNAVLTADHVTLESGVTLTLDGSTVTAAFNDDASGATIQVDGGQTLTLDGASIIGGTVNDFSTDASGSIIAGDIDVKGDSTIAFAHVNHGDITLASDAVLTLDGSTITGTSFDDTASGAVIQVDGFTGDTVTLTNVSINGGGLTVAAHGLVQTNGDVTLTNAAVTNDGTIEVTGGKLTITGTGSVADGVPSDGGTIQIDGGATLDLSASDTQNVSFSSTDPGGILQIDTGSFGGSIVGLAATDQIDLSTIGYGLGTTASYVSNADHTGGTLKVTDGHDSIALQLVGDYTNAHFAGSADGNGTLITVNADDDAPAFAPGEATPAGTVAEVADVTGSPATDDSSPAGGAIHFTDIDLTDRPTPTVTQTVTWSGGTLSNLEASALEGGFQLTPVTNTNNGEIDWTYSIADNSLDFLGTGETATVTSTITLNDHQGGQDTAIVTVTVTGANDVPTITATDNGFTEAPNVTANGATDTVTGAITFTDADVDDRPTVTASFASFDYKDAQGDDLTATLTPDQQAAVTALETDLTLSASDGNANNGSYGWSYSVIDSALDFMAAGDKLVLTYNATVDDHNGGTASTPVTVTITGSDDAPTLGFTQDVPVSTDENHAVTIDGITVNDVDAGNSQIEVTVAAGHGSIALSDATGLDSTHPNSDGSIDLFGSQAAINTALSHGVIYTPAADFSGADTLTVTANDQVSAALGGPLTGSEQIAVNVEPGTPDFTAMTLTIAQGATVVLSDANFSISDPDTTHFLYTVNNVTGGQFEVQHDGTWMPAPTGGFTTQQVEANQVEFVQDGTDTTPGFTIFATDGTNASATIASTVSFAPTPPVAHDDVLSGPSGSGWMLDTDNGHYYREVATFGSFETAVANAAADGGYLATITSAAEQSFVVNHVIDGFSATWLGGVTNNDRPDGMTVNESVWSWVTGPEAGTQFTYTNWNPGEPSGGFEATTQWLQIGPTGGWNDAPDVGQLGDGQGAGYLEEWGGTPTQVTFLENTGTSIDTSVLLANDVDANGLPLTVTAVGDGTGHTAHGGTVSLNGDIVTYTPSADYSGADSFSYTITDGSGTSTATVSLDVVPGTPVFTGMTLTVAQGATDVLTDANFAITDPLTSHFSYTVSNVSGGQFEVSNGSSWTAATSFTTAQVEAGHVEFVQDGSATAPNFSIMAADGTNHSAAVAPTVDFEATHALAPANLIVNGGFETYDYTGWTISGVATPDSVVVGPYHEDFSNDVPHTGSHEALVGSQPEEMTLSQTVATTDGAHYTVDFWAMQDQPPIIGDDFSASWNGTTLTSLVDVGQQSGYTEYQFDVTGAAGSTSSTLTFSANNEGYWDIDDVSVLKGAPTTVQEMSDTTTAVAGVNATDTLTVTPSANAIGSVTATASNGTVEWQFEATNAQLDHLMGLTQSFTVADTNNASVSQTVAVSVGGNGNDQFVFHAGVGADTMVNFSTLTTAQGAYAGDTIELANFTGIASPSDVLAHLSADSHGNAVVDLGNHDSITFQGLSVAQIQANASHIFHV